MTYYVCRGKVARVAVVAAPTNGDANTSGEDETDEEEVPEVDDAEILEDLPDDTEVCVPIICSFLC